MSDKKNKWGLLGRSDYHYIIPFIIGVTVLVVLWLGFFARNSLMDWARSSLQERSQKRQMERLQREIQEMDAEIQALSRNRDSLEKYARETYHFAAPGEDVYILE